MCTLLKNLPLLVSREVDMCACTLMLAVIKPAAGSFSQWQYGESAIEELSKVAPKVSYRSFSSQGLKSRNHEYIYSICERMRQTSCTSSFVIISSLLKF